MLFGTDKLQSVCLFLLVSLFCFNQMACAQQSAAQKEKQRIEQVTKHEEAAKRFREKGDFQAALQEQQKAVKKLRAKFILLDAVYDEMNLIKHGTTNDDLPIAAKGDGIYTGTEDAAGIVYWDGATYRWKQACD